jgi:hypothetical protein
MAEIDFDAPLPGNAQQRDEAKKVALGLRLEELRELVAALDAQLSAEAWGYAQLDDIDDEVQRAVVSDQIRSAAHGIEENLLEARLHELDVGDLVGPNGLSMPYSNASINDHLRYDRLELHIVGFFRAFGSALDCLAAALIGAVRVPMSIRLADMGRLTTFDPEAGGRLWPDNVPETQREAWRALIDLLAAARKREPAGWYVWGLEDEKRAPSSRARRERPSSAANEWPPSGRERDAARGASAVRLLPAEAAMVT